MEERKDSQLYIQTEGDEMNQKHFRGKGINQTHFNEFKENNSRMANIRRSNDSYVKGSYENMNDSQINMYTESMNSNSYIYS